MKKSSHNLSHWSSFAPAPPPSASPPPPPAQHLDSDARQWGRQWRRWPPRSWATSPSSVSVNAPSKLLPTWTRPLASRSLIPVPRSTLCVRPLLVVWLWMDEWISRRASSRGPTQPRRHANCYRGRGRCTWRATGDEFAEIAARDLVIFPNVWAAPGTRRCRRQALQLRVPHERTPFSRPSPHRSPSRAALPELKQCSTMVRGGGNCRGTRTHIEPRRIAGSHPAGRRTRFSPLPTPLLFQRAKIVSPIRLRRITVGGQRLCSKWEKQRRYMDGL